MSLEVARVASPQGFCGAGCQPAGLLSLTMNAAVVRVASPFSMSFEAVRVASPQGF